MLTDKGIKAARPRGEAYKLADGGGLHLYVSRAGGKLWRVRHEVGGKEKLLSLGSYGLAVEDVAAVCGFGTIAPGSPSWSGRVSRP